MLSFIVFTATWLLVIITVFMIIGGDDILEDDENCDGDSDTDYTVRKSQ